MILNKKITFNGLKSVFTTNDMKDIHLTPRFPRSTDYAAAMYCLKDATRKAGTEPREFGTRPAKAKGGAQDQAIKMLQEHKSLNEVAQLFPAVFLNRSNGLRALATAYQADNDAKKLQMPTVKVYWGETGSGKTHRAMEDAQAFALERKLNIAPCVEFNNGFLINYQGEGIMILNEFRGDMPISKFLQLTDKWPYKANIKYGTIDINAILIIITSPVHPSEWYKWTAGDSEDQLKRRISSITECKRDQNAGEVKWNDH